MSTESESQSHLKNFSEFAPASRPRVFRSGDSRGNSRTRHSTGANAAVGKTLFCRGFQRKCRRRFFDFSLEAGSPGGFAR
jgi:hypothetical protein